MILLADICRYFHADVKYGCTDMQATLSNAAGEHQVGHASEADMWIQRSTATVAVNNISTHQIFASACIALALSSALTFE